MSDTDSVDFSSDGAFSSQSDGEVPYDSDAVSEHSESSAGSEVEKKPADIVPPSNTGPLPKLGASKRLEASEDEEDNVSMEEDDEESEDEDSEDTPRVHTIPDKKATYEEQLDEYLAKFTEMFQEDLLALQNQDSFDRNHIPLLKDVLETGMNIWSQYDVI